MPKVKYHINPNTGRPNQCTATVRDCKYAVNGELPEHYETKEEAKQAAEKLMNNKHGVTNTLKKKSDSNGSVTKAKNDIVNGSDDDNSSKKHLNLKSYHNVFVCTPSGTEFALYSTEASNGYSNEVYQGITNSWQNHYRHVDEYTNGLDFNDGDYYYLTPNEPYHGSDVKYLLSPTFKITNKILFTQDYFRSGFDQVLTKYDIDNVLNDDNTIKNLKDIGFYDEDNYEAEIEGGYYGEEFRGFILEDSHIEDQAVDIIAMRVAINAANIVEDNQENGK